MWLTAVVVVGAAVNCVRRSDEAIDNSAAALVLAFRTHASSLRSGGCDSRLIKF